VVGGGIAGMSAALAIADNGFKVHLVERTDRLGGNLTWMTRTLEGHSVEALLEEKQQAVQKHPLVDVQLQAQVISSSGDVGQFETIVEDADGKVQSLRHGTVILATGGNEAATDAYGHGDSTAVVTQKELACRLADGSIDPQGLASVVMIQCVGSREEPRNYCSRVCCATALKHALELRSANPELQIFILYRDVMTYGFLETFYTRARQEGVLFIPYDVAEKPRAAADGSGVTVEVREPLIDRPLQIEADLLVLATGVSPNLPPDLAQLFGAVVDPDGFFQQADAKWRPVDCLKEGVFACGLAHSPRNIPETIATAEAAAQQSLKILTREQLPVARVTARVRHAICSLCERCIDLCPYGARSIDSERGRLEVNPAMCQGCGSCAAACPSGAAVLNAHSEQQMLEEIDVALG
jgi:heterodisulfide reductase subunit A